MMQMAIIVVDMLADYFREEAGLPITREARALIDPINELTAAARGARQPVIFACDSFLEGDFLFGGKMKAHAIRGTAGAEPTPLLHREPGDIVLPKRRFSAFFKTDLDQTLRTLGVEGVAVCGITTHFCVLTTVLDAICHDFHAVWLEDCCASHKRSVHQATVELYRNNPLYPLLRVMGRRELMKELG